MTAWPEMAFLRITGAPLQRAAQPAATLPLSAADIETCGMHGMRLAEYTMLCALEQRPPNGRKSMSCTVLSPLDRSFWTSHQMSSEAQDWG